MTRVTLCFFLPKSNYFYSPFNLLTCRCSTLLHRGYSIFRGKRELPLNPKSKLKLQVELFLLSVNLSRWAESSVENRDCNIEDICGCLHLGITNFCGSSSDFVKLTDHKNSSICNFIVPTFDTKVTEYLCSGWVFFLQTNFDFLTSHF